MLKLIQKESTTFIFYTVCLMIVSTLIIGFDTQKIDYDALSMLGYLFIFIVLAANYNEAIEEKNKGYKFLKTLPISSSELVGSKFLIVFLCTVVLDIYFFVLFSVFSSTVEVQSFYHSYILIISAIELIITGIFYLFIMRFGYSASFKIIIVLVILSFVFVPIFIREVLFISERSYFNYISSIKDLNMFIIIPVVLITYFLLYYFSAGFLKKYNQKD